MSNFQLWWCFYTWVVKLYSSSYNKTQKLNLSDVAGGDGWLWQKSVDFGSQNHALPSVTCMLSADAEWSSHDVENEWCYSLSLSFCFCQAKPYAEEKTELLLWKCKSEERSRIGCLPFTRNLHFHCWHIFVNTSSKSSWGSESFIPRMPHLPHSSVRQFLFILKGLERRAASSFLGLACKHFLGHIFHIPAPVICLLQQSWTNVSSIRHTCMSKCSFYDIFYIFT